jgi:hypothetical protein
MQDIISLNFDAAIDLQVYYRLDSLELDILFIRPVIIGIKDMT